MYCKQDIRRAVDRSTCSRRLRGAASVAVLLAGLATAQPAHAGAIGDAFGTFAGWVSQIEEAISNWFGTTLGEIRVRGRDTLAAETIAGMALRDPDGLNALAERAGFRFAGFTLTHRGRRVEEVTFAFDRAIEREGRLALWREVLELEDTPVKPEMELVRLLLEATDLRQDETPAGFRMVAVTIEIDDELAARSRFTAETAAQ